MFLHIGKSYSIPIDDIVAIMDVNSLLNSKDSKSYLKKMKEKGLLFITNSDERNIKTIIGISGRVDDVLEAFIAGTLESGESTCEHH